MIAPKLVQFAGSQAARQTLQKHSKTGGALDLKFGMHLLFREREVSPLHKLLALGLGAALTWFLIALETPLEAIVATFLPLAGIAIDALIDGAEVIICPLIFASLMLPYLAPKVLVEALRSTRSGMPQPIR